MTTTTFKTETKRERTAAMLERCRQAFPGLFPRGFWGWKPLGVGIRDRIAERLELTDPHELASLKAVMAAHAGSIPYLRAVSRGGKRVDVQGNPCGEVTEAERTQAMQRLKRRLAEVCKAAKPRTPGKPTKPRGKPAAPVVTRKTRKSIPKEAQK